MDRPGSIMLFGQRRVGKTSLLFQMVEELPPHKGSVAGAFVDVSGLAPGAESFSKALFDLICSALALLC
jgi:AAA+ ATPase superfamily predicted ATPase